MRSPAPVKQNIHHLAYHTSSSSSAFSTVYLFRGCVGGEGGGLVGVSTEGEGDSARGDDVVLEGRLVGVDRVFFFFFKFPESAGANIRPRSP